MTAVSCVFGAVWSAGTAQAFDPGSGSLALTLEDNPVGTLRLADRRITRRPDGETAPVQVLLFVDAGRRLVSAGNDASVFLWNFEVGSRTGEPQRSRP